MKNMIVYPQMPSNTAPVQVIQEKTEEEGGNPAE